MMNTRQIAAVAAGGRSMWLWLAIAACKHPADDVETGEPDTGDTDTSAAPLLDEAALEALADAVDGDLNGNKASGCQIAVYKDGVLAWHGEFGSADPSDDSKLVTSDMLFQIGSDTKKLTALALLQQEAAGNLSRADTVASAIPGLALAVSPEWAPAATLHSLISHQGGLYDDTPWDDHPDDAYLHDRAFGDFAANAWQMSPPGAMWNYANPNFGIAGLATEVAAERPWADVIEDDIFQPLGMTRSFARKADVVADGNYAIGTGYTGHADDPYDPFFSDGTWQMGRASMDDVADNAFTRPAGLVWSTASDTARYGAFLIDGDDAVIDAERHADLSTPQVRLYPSYAPQSYAYGLMVFDGITLPDGFHDVRVWTHGGNTLSFTSTTWMVPSDRVSISILSNGYGDDFTETLVTLLPLVADLGPVTEPEPPSPDETDHALLVGTYHDVYLGDFEVFDDDGVLKIDIPRLEAAGLNAAGAPLTRALLDVYTFRIGNGRYDITFVADSDGTYTWARNRMFVGTKAPPAAAPRGPDRAPDPASLAIARAEMDAQLRWLPQRTR